MPYRLELSYKDALDGVFAKRDTSYTPLDPFFLNMGATVTKCHVDTPEIDFKNNKHIENIRQLLSRARDDCRVKKVIIELDDSESRKEITEGFCELAFIPKILAQITDKADVDLTVGKGKDKNEAEGGMSGLISKDIDKILDEVVLMGTSLVVRSQIKNFAKIDGKQLNITEDFYDELNKKVEKLIEESSKRAKLNNRNTLMGRDI